MKVRHEPTKYTYVVAWSPDDGSYVGTCLEFPSLSYLARGRTETLIGITQVVAGAIRGLVMIDEVVPRPRWMIADDVGIGSPE